MLYNVNGEETFQNFPFPWDFVTLLEKDRATAIAISPSGLAHPEYSPQPAKE